MSRILVDHFRSEFGNIGDDVHDQSSMIVIDRILNFYTTLLERDLLPTPEAPDVELGETINLRLMEYTQHLTPTLVRTIHIPESDPSQLPYIGDIRLSDFYTEQSIAKGQTAIESTTLINELNLSLYTVFTGHEIGGDPEPDVEQRRVSFSEAIKMLNYITALIQNEHANKITYTVYGFDHPLRVFDEFPNQQNGITDVNSDWTVAIVDDQTHVSEILDKAIQSRVLHIHIRANDDNELYISQQLMVVLMHLNILTTRFGVHVRIYIDGEDQTPETTLLNPLTSGFAMPGVSVFSGDHGLDTLLAIEGLLVYKEAIINGDIV